SARIAHADRALLSSPTGLLFLAVRSAFAQVVLEQFPAQRAAALGGDDFAGEHAGDDLCVFIIPRTGADLAHVKNFRRSFAEKIPIAHEHDVTIPFPLDGVVRNDNGVLLLPEDDPAGTEGMGPQPAIAIVQVSANLDRARLFVNGRADPGDCTGHFLPAAV